MRPRILTGLLLFAGLLQSWAIPAEIVGIQQSHALASGEQQELYDAEVAFRWATGLESRAGSSHLRHRIEVEDRGVSEALPSNESQSFPEPLQLNRQEARSSAATIFSDGFESGDCSAWTASSDCAAGVPSPTVTTVSPDFGSVEGGTLVTVTGTNLENATATLSGLAVPVSVDLDGTSLFFMTPAHAQGDATLEITTPGGTVSRPSAFTWVLRLKAPRIITADGVRGEWSDDYLLAIETTPSSWGTENTLQTLSVAYDDTDLFIGIDGEVEAPDNALTIFIDRDFGAATGVADLRTLTDNHGALDDPCSAILNPSGIAGFGAEFCAGTKAMASVEIGATFPDTDTAGMRDIATDLASFGWAVSPDPPFGSTVVVAATTTGTPGVEILIPWSEIYGASGLPSAGTLAMFVRISDPAGENHANQGLPQDGSTLPTVSTVAAVVLRR